MAASNYVFDITSANFEQLVLQASMQHPVLVDFWAPWCGPCQSLSPILEKLADEYAGAFTLAKINTDDEQILATQFGIRSLPTVVLLHNGEVVDHFMGAQPEGVIRQLLERHVGAPQPAPEEDGAPTAAGLDPSVAVATLQQKITQEPDNQELKVQLADALLRTGELESARKLLDALSGEAKDGDAAKTATARLQFADAVAGAPDATSLEQRLSDDPNDLQARYQLGIQQILNGQAENGLEHFLEIMKRDRSFEDDLGRRSLVNAFQILSDTTLVSRYRQKMTSLLF